MELIDLLHRRRRFLDATRRFFRERGFLEVETPVLVAHPEATPQIDPFRTEHRQEGRPPAPLWLHSSPEHLMKRLLVQGSGPIFQIVPFYRCGEIGPLHNPEFLGLEWYQPGSDYRGMMDQTEELVRALAEEMGTPREIDVRGRRVALSGPWERITVPEAMERYARVPPEVLLDPDALRAHLQERGHRPAPEEEYDDLFFRLFLEEVEPHLGWPRPTFLHDYPLPMGALARRSQQDPRLAERAELYIGPVELCNAYSELTDPEEQEARFRRDLARMHSEAPPEPDQGLLQALRQGLPDCGGNALGLERLLMVLLEEQELAAVLPFPLDRLLAERPPEGG